MDSTALRVLAAEGERMEGCLRLVVRAPQIRRLMRVTGYFDGLNVYKTPEDAMRASAQAPRTPLAAALEDI